VSLSLLPKIALALLILLCPSHLLADGFVNSQGIEFVLIEPGTFFMGTDEGKAEEGPRHQVTLTEPFYISSCEISQNIYEKLIQVNPSRFENNSAPADNISWADAFEFIVMLNGLENTSGYKLPSEAQWEYAARANSDTLTFLGENTNLEEYAWFSENSQNSTHAVKGKLPNPFGLYDIYGNVWEWVEDWYNPLYYAQSEKNDPKGPRSGLEKIVRGGAFFNSRHILNSVSRYSINPTLRYNSVGFRVVFMGDPSKLPSPSGSEK
jgi:formylglycine-generating enzyme required for sulfatase activity